MSAVRIPQTMIEFNPKRRNLLLGLAVAGLAGCRATPPAPSASSPVSSAPAPAETPPRPLRIGLALGGGAARGFAHIGVLQVLEAAGIRADLAAGTSAGSLVAALWATGMDAQTLARTATTLDESALTDWTFPGRGLLRGEALAAWVRARTSGRLIEQLPRPLGIVACDLQSGDAALFRRGDVGEAVRASSAVPSVFQPVRIGGREYVDGGLVAPVPVRQAREMGAEFVIAVDIATPPQAEPPSDAIRLLLQTFSIMGRNLAAHEVREADVLIRPALAGIAGTDFTVRAQAMERGRQAAQAALPALRAKLAARAAVPGR